MSMMDVRLHETVSVSGQAESVREALESALPPLSGAHAQLVYLSSLHSTLCTLLAGNIRQNPYFYSPHVAGHPETRGVRALKQTRTTLARLLLDHDEVFGAAADANRVPGWNRLMLVWVITCQLSICLQRLATTNPNPHPGVDVAATVQHVRDDNAVLLRNELLTTAGGLADVTNMSMREMRRAIDVLRDRLFMLDEGGSSVLRYMQRLEQRAGAFACGTVDQTGDYDEPLWTEKTTEKTTENSTVRATRSFVATMAWQFVWLRRHVLDYLQTAAASFYATATRRQSAIVTIQDVVRPGGTLPERGRAVAAFVLRMAKTMDTEDHRREFSLVAAEYNVSPGDLDAHSHVHGMSGVERATVRDVVGRRRCPAGTTYAARGKWKCRLDEWIESAQQRARLNGPGRQAGGGTACEAFLEQLCILHVLNSFFVSKLKVKWMRWFVVMHRGAGRAFQLRVSQGVRNGLPFIFQRLGHWACCVPSVPPPFTHRAIELQTNLFGNDVPGNDHDGEDEQQQQQHHHHQHEADGAGGMAAVVYLCRDVFEAVTLWATFLSEGWQGRIHHSGRPLRPALRALLGIA